MRCIVLLARWRGWLSARLRPHAPLRRRWFGRPWLWWAFLILLYLLCQHATHTPAAALPPAAHGGFGPLVAFAPAQPTTAQEAQQPASCGVTDLSSCINDWLNSFTKNTVADWLNMQVGNLANLLFIFHTPDQLTYHAPPVQAMYTYSLGVVGALLTFILAVAGINYMTGRSVEWSQTLPQVVMCGIMAWGFQPFIALFIELGNDFIFGMQFAVGVQPTFPAYGASANAFMDILAFIIELLADLLLALEALARLALLDLLIAIAPLGIMCYALPQSRAWGRMWAEAFAATILIQPIQTMLVLLGAKMVSLLVTFFQAGIPPLVQILVGLASIILALKVPQLLLSRATHLVSDFHNETARIASVFAGV